MLIMSNSGFEENLDYYKLDPEGPLRNVQISGESVIPCQIPPRIPHFPPCFLKDILVDFSSQNLLVKVMRSTEYPWIA